MPDRPSSPPVPPADVRPSVPSSPAAPLAAYGWDDRVAARFTLLEHLGGAPGRVARVDRGSCLVVTAEGRRRATPFARASKLAGLAETPVTGDWVVVVHDSEEGPAVVGLVPRWSAITRRHPGEGVATEQVLAANVDVLAVVCGLDQPLVPSRVERMLVSAWESGAVPVLVLSKADLAPDLDRVVAEVEVLAGGVAVHPTSTVSGVGLDPVRALVGPGRTLALIGPSGAGKSSLVNALVGSDVQSTGAVREGDRRGRHTTTTRDLVSVGGGGVLLDTPGLRMFGLWDAPSGVVEAFTDVEGWAAACRFRDCRHGAEPGCAVQGAVASGALDRRRLDSYNTLQRELVALERRQDAQARRAAGRRSGRMAKEAQKAKGRGAPRAGST